MLIFAGGNFSFLLNIMGCAYRDEQMSVWDDKFSILNDEQLPGTRCAPTS